MKQDSEDRIEIEKKKTESFTCPPLGDQFGHFDIKDPIVTDDKRMKRHIQSDHESEPQEDKDNPAFPFAEEKVVSPLGNLCCLSLYVTFKISHPSP